MHKTKVKICGLQDVEVLKSMVNLPIDYIGLVFAKSRRKVSYEQGAALLGQLSAWRNGPPPQSAGVVVNPRLEELEELLAGVPLDIVQLHGQESPEFCRQVKQAFPGIQVWKALSVSEADSGGKSAGFVELESYSGAVDAVLLDTYDPQQGGGSGRTFAWGEIPAYKKSAAEHNLPLFIAGGLHPANVGDLLASYRPDGVDVSSGVETNGIKDLAKMTAFVERVKLS